MKPISYDKISTSPTGLSNLLSAINRYLADKEFCTAHYNISILEKSFPELNNLANFLRKLTNKYHFRLMRRNSARILAALIKESDLATSDSFSQVRTSFHDEAGRYILHGIQDNGQSLNKNRNWFPLEDRANSNFDDCTNSAYLNDNYLQLNIENATFWENLSLIFIEGWILRGDDCIDSLELTTRSHSVHILPSLMYRYSRIDVINEAKKLGLGLDSVASAGFKIAVPLIANAEIIEKIAADTMIIRWHIKTSKASAQIISQRINIAEQSEKSPANIIRSSIATLISDRMECLSKEAIIQLSENNELRTRKNLQSDNDHRSYGRRVDNPELSIIVPLYGRIDFMEIQISTFNNLLLKSKTKQTFQLIYVLDDPALRDAILSAADRCVLIYNIRFDVITNKVNIGFAGSSNLGASIANAPWLLLMNSDVIPVSLESIDIMIKCALFDSNIGAVGAQLLYANGSIQHLGMEFSMQNWQPGNLSKTWLNTHPLKNSDAIKLPLEKNPFVICEAVTGACMLVSRSLYKKLDGLPMNYLIGDFEDSDFCLKLRERNLLCAVATSATFYHLERQSFDCNISDSLNSLKLVAANAMIHHHRWNKRINSLKNFLPNS